jgi:hypothetical protein
VLRSARARGNNLGCSQSSGSNSQTGSRHQEYTDLIPDTKAIYAGNPPEVPLHASFIGVGRAQWRTPKNQAGRKSASTSPLRPISRSISHCAAAPEPVDTEESRISSAGTAPPSPWTKARHGSSDGMLDRDAPYLCFNWRPYGESQLTPIRRKVTFTAAAPPPLAFAACALAALPGNTATCPLDVHAPTVYSK